MYAANKQMNKLSIGFPLGNPETMPAILQSAAEEMAKKAVADMGLAGEFTLNHITFDDFADNYYFYFTKSYRGVPLTFTSVGYTAFSGAYSVPWEYEHIRVCVTNNGLYSLDWVSPSIEGEVLSEGVSVLPFEDIQELFKQNLQYCLGVGTNEPGVISQRVNVTEIRLGMARVAIKDKPDEFMMVPTWDFFGTLTNTYSGPQPGGWALDENNQHTDEWYLDLDAGFLCINAIDGSIIDREKGY